MQIDRDNALLLRNIEALNNRPKTAEPFYKATLQTNRAAEMTRIAMENKVLCLFCRTFGDI